MSDVVDQVLAQGGPRANPFLHLFLLRGWDLFECAQVIIKSAVCQLGVDINFSLNLHASQFYIARVYQYGLDGSEAEVVVPLKSQLLVDQAERACDLKGEVTRCREPNTVE